MSIKIKNPCTIMGGGNSVSYEPQDLTPSQQEQARENIGAAAAGDAKTYYTHVFHAVFAGNSDEVIISWIDTVRHLSSISYWYYSIYQDAISADTAYPVIVRTSTNEYVAGALYATKDANYDAFMVLYGGRSYGPYRTNNLTSFTDVVCGETT